MVLENVYGHAKRLKWIESYILEHSQIVELGCGTGYMITLPLAKKGHSIKGLDLDKESIEYGKAIFKEESLNETQLIHQDIASLEEKPDIIIASEVFEHLIDEDLGRALKTIHSQLPAGGLLLVTVPNGYGWFEFESFIWNQLHLGKLLKIMGVINLIERIKLFLFGKDIIHPPHPSSISNSPHVQRFTLSQIQTLLREHNFEIIQSVGSTLFSGQFSNLFFHGIKSFSRLNNYLGTSFPRLASGFYISCRSVSNTRP
jgi:SAM-dependent methyltransferase